MGEFVWKHPERRELYLATRILADANGDGDWLQWASDTILDDLELHDDPQQGLGLWISKEELCIASELCDALWVLVQENPFQAGDLLSNEVPDSVQQAAAALAALIMANGRR